MLISQVKYLVFRKNVNDPYQNIVCLSVFHQTQEDEQYSTETVINRNMVTLKSFPSLPQKNIKPKVFCITFRMNRNHTNQLISTIKSYDDLSAREILRKFCRQVIQLRKTTKEDNVYLLIIENISNRKMKSNLMDALKDLGPDKIELMTTAEIVNGELTHAKLYETLNWEDVSTVFFKTYEKDRIKKLKQGEIHEKEIYNNQDTVLLVHQWTTHKQIT